MGYLRPQWAEILDLTDNDAPILITSDTDFGELVFKTSDAVGHDTKGVVSLVSCKNVYGTFGATGFQLICGWASISCFAPLVARKGVRLREIFRITSFFHIRLPRGGGSPRQPLRVKAFGKFLGPQLFRPVAKQLEAFGKFVLQIFATFPYRTVQNHLV